MLVKPLRVDLEKYLRKHNLTKIFLKQVALFQGNINHPSLNTEPVVPKNLRLYSFRITRKYRAIFTIDSPNEVEIVDINNHYQ